jgi:hypothetical protein
MQKEIVAGISFSGDTAHTVVFEISEKGTELRFLLEHKRQSTAETWFLDGFLNSKDKYVEKATRVSIGLDHALLLLYTFPIDTSLTRPEMNEHVQWELSLIIPDFQKKEFINDLHYLTVRGREQTADVFVVNVRRSLIYSIQQLLSGKKYDLHIADANYFGAQNALFINYPSVKTENTLLAGFSDGRVDIGTISKGRLFDYHYLLHQSEEEILAFLQPVIEQASPTALYHYGLGQDTSIISSVETTFGVPVRALNPLLRIGVNSSVRGYELFAGNEYRLAASAGIALRKQ